ncbi:MAG: sugar ABC transporter permease [Microbacteriaceae bacterium]|nr:sugar ABC transporter permease [Microbacteriaceae bacterium]
MATVELRAASSARGTTTKVKKRKKFNSETLPGVLMASPALIGVIGFVALPFVVAIVLSFFNVRLNSVRPPIFFGIEQYVRLFTDPIYSVPFFRALVNNLSFAVVVVPVQTAIALALAILLNRKIRGIAFFRTLFFMPVVFPMALVTVLWRLILDRSDNGLLNSVVSFLTGGAVGAHDWLGSPTTAMGSVILLSIWQGVGFQMVIILAGLQEIPQERYEAAQLDRAGAWAQFRHVTVPGIRNTLIFVVLLTTILSFRVFDQVYILIRGAGLNQDATRTVLYQATVTIFDENNVGQAAAITVVFFIIVVALTLVQRRVLRQTSED